MAVVQYHYTAIVQGLSNELHSIHYDQTKTCNHYQQLY